MSAQEVVATTLSGTDVSVVFDATSPYADLTNKVIHLRPVPDQLSEEDVEDIRGDCDHELGHVLHTNPAPLENIKRKLVLRIAEAIEDGRVEKLVGAEWIGCGENLEKSADRAVARILEAKSDDEVNRRARALCGLSMLAYGRSLKSVLVALGEDIAPYYADLDHALTLVHRCPTTQAAVDLAIIVADAWEWRPVRPSKAKSGQAKENAAARELGELYLSPASARKQSVASLSGGDTQGSYRAQVDRDKTQVISRPSFQISNLYGVFFDGVRKTVPGLRRRLMMQFMSSGQKYRRHQKKGCLDGRGLWKSGIGDDRIYQRKRPTKTNRSIVTILVDCSASMTRAARGPDYEGEPLAFRTRLFIAAQAAAAVSATLDVIGVPNEVLAFTTTRRTPASRPGFDRVRPLRHLIIKPYTKPFRSCRDNFVSLAFFERCAENIDGEALLWASRRILSKPNHGDQPVLMVFSDGEPASEPESNAILCQNLRESIKRVEASGITVFGIGVGSDSVSRFYGNFVVVTAVNNLLATFYDLIKKVLQERQSSRV
jgi:hypothetical protein